MCWSNLHRMHSESNSFTDLGPKRVKVYVLENNEWKDSGTGFCTGELVQNESPIDTADDATDGDSAALTEATDGRDIKENKRSAYLIVTSEENPSDVLLRSKLEGKIEYQRQEDTLIVWKDLEGRDIALSFEESSGCDSLCDFIVQVQKHIEKNISLVAVRTSASGTGTVHEIIAGPVDLPSNSREQTTESLLEALRVLNLNTAYKYYRDKTVDYVLHSDYLEILFQHFKKAEGSRHLKDLFLLSNIVKTLILYNRREIIEVMVDDNHIIGVLGILEYDTEFPTLKASHRDYMKNRGPSFKEVLPCNNKELMQMVRKCFRLQFLRDVVLVRFLNDYNLTLFTDILLDLETNIVDFLTKDKYLKSVLDLYNPAKTPELQELYPDLSEKRTDGIRLLNQCVQMSKNLESPCKTEFYKSLVKNGLFDAVDYALNSETNLNIRVLATDAMIKIMENNLFLINSIQVSQMHMINTKSSESDNPDETKELQGHKRRHTDTDPSSGNEITEDMKFVLVLSKILLADKTPGLQEQVFQALITLLDPNGCLDVADDNQTGLNGYDGGVAQGYRGKFDAQTFLLDDGDEHPHGNGADEYDLSSSHLLLSTMNGTSETRQVENYLDKFYSQIAPILFSHLIIDNSGSGTTKHPVDDHILIQLVKLVAFICTEHDRLLSRKFVLERGILRSISQLIEPTHILQLRLCAVRCLKSIICLDDKYYQRYLISNNLFDSMFEMLKENHGKDNLASSCILDLCRVIANRCLSLDFNNTKFVEYESLEKIDSSGRTNFTVLNRYLVQRYNDVLQQLREIPFIDAMIRYEREQDKIYDGTVSIENEQRVDGKGFMDDVLVKGNIEEFPVLLT